ncbi:ABC transporter ATP-binding protein [Rhodopila sp.]|jgi:peptide/nickel transport system ATP-binding protein|uniref:ABC transporter ATP-binding protein n=1 Tax=Rhodopila sp. TaxID=2480087 RepID=UPI002BD689C5|nr:ABC transporter ATP-binding protein [Rhodopila sp.]HVZ08183.1 ABC transporter ATP-binding protein [Rhodopila sp.]
MSALIELRTVGKTFSGGKVALEDVSLALQEDQPRFIAVVGESGSGKTTLARLLLGMIEPTTGTVRYRGEDLAGLSGARRNAFRREVQAVFQDPYEVYNPFYRVDHVLTTPVRKFRLAATRTEGRGLIEAALRSVGLRPEEILGRYPHQLSGGQRQRIMVARALLLRPRLIVADEPVSMVDASLRATILSSLRRLHEEMRISILYITHDLATAYQVADSIIVLYRAAVAEAGHVERVVKAPLHPYTQLLIGSIPLVSTERSWVEDKPAAGRPGGAGCHFADRCPSAMDHCLSAAPSLFQVAPDHAAACFLRADAPALAEGALSSVLG